MEKKREKNCKDGKCADKNVDFAREIRPEKEKCKSEDKCR